MHRRKISKFGNGLYVLIDKAVLNMLGLKEKDVVGLTLENGKIVIKPSKKIEA